MAELIQYEAPATYGGLINDRRRSVSGRLAIIAARLLIAPLPFLLVGAMAAVIMPKVIGSRATRQAEWALGAPTVVVLLLTCAVVFIRTMRKRRGAQVLSYLEQAVRLNLPLPRMLHAAEESERGPLRRRLTSVREMVEAGVPVGIALEMVVPEVPDRSVQLIKAAERLGRLPVTLRRLVGENRRPDENAATRILSVVYPIGIATFLVMILWLIGVFVIPKFEQIMRDFNVPVPRSTQMLISAVRELAIPGTIGAALILILYGAVRMWELFAPASRGGTWGWIDAVLWRIPVLHGLHRDRGLADAFGVIAEATTAGYTLDRAVLEASELRINGVLRVRLERWVHGIHNGLSPDQSARLANLPPLVSGMVATAAATGGHAYQFLSRYYEIRHGRLAALVRAAVGPVLAITFGAAVALTAVGMFAPLAEITRQLSFDTGYW